MNVILEAKNVTKTIRDNEILRGISLQIMEKDFLSIIGVSGSGKSTLMYILGLLDIPTTGEILIDNRPVDFEDKKSISNIRNKRIGFVFQFHYLISELSAAENIMVPIIKSNNNKSEAQDRAYHLLENLGLKGMEKRKPYELSGGEQQRVAIARALANNPDIIMADEPTGDLDSKNSRMVMDIFLEMNERGKAVLMITHETDLAEQTKRVIVMKDGVIDELVSIGKLGALTNESNGS